MLTSRLAYLFFLSVALTSNQPRTKQLEAGGAWQIGQARQKSGMLDAILLGGSLVCVCAPFIYHYHVVSPITLLKAIKNVEELEKKAFRRSMGYYLALYALGWGLGYTIYFACRYWYSNWGGYRLLETVLIIVWGGVSLLISVNAHKKSIDASILKAYKAHTNAHVEKLRKIIENHTPEINQKTSNSDDEKEPEPSDVEDLKNGIEAINQALLSLDRLAPGVAKTEKQSIQKALKPLYQTSSGLNKALKSAKEAYCNSYYRNYGLLYKGLSEKDQKTTYYTKEQIDAYQEKENRDIMDPLPKEETIGDGTEKRSREKILETFDQAYRWLKPSADLFDQKKPTISSKLNRLDVSNWPKEARKPYPASNPSNSSKYTEEELFKAFIFRLEIIVTYGLETTLLQQTVDPPYNLTYKAPDHSLNILKSLLVVVDHIRVAERSAAEGSDLNNIQDIKKIVEAGFIYFSKSIQQAAEEHTSLGEIRKKQSAWQDMIRDVFKKKYSSILTSNYASYLKETESQQIETIIDKKNRIRDQINTEINEQKTEEEKKPYRRLKTFFKRSVKMYSLFNDKHLDWKKMNLQIDIVE